jgi:hypothetical protein
VAPDWLKEQVLPDW